MWEWPFTLVAIILQTWTRLQGRINATQCQLQAWALTGDSEHFPALRAEELRGGWWEAFPRRHCRVKLSDNCFNALFNDYAFQTAVFLRIMIACFHVALPSLRPAVFVCLSSLQSCSVGAQGSGVNQLSVSFHFLLGKFHLTFHQHSKLKLSRKKYHRHTHPLPLMIFQLRHGTAL
jgi:hypothetical protein